MPHFKRMVIAGILGLVALSLFPETTWACPMCQPEVSDPAALSFSVSALFLFSMPYFLIGFLGLQLARAINPQGYALARDRIVSFRKSRRGYALMGVFGMLVLYSVFSPTALGAFNQSALPLPRAQLVAQTNLNGKSIESISLDNNVVVLNFFASWCEPCKAEVDDLSNLYREYQPQGVEVIGIALDLAGEPHRHPDGAIHFHPEPNALPTLIGFVQAHQLSYAVIPTSAPIENYFGGTKAIPATYLFSRRGILSKTYYG
ncbi:MAG: TlpA family protein disulfide reductase, partial [Chloroflexi bacterium]|nr:TlpA family protein disulfide reductase [Chloroflexota bacterium]